MLPPPSLHPDAFLPVVQSSRLSNPRETKGLQPVLGAGSWPSYQAVVPSLTTLAALRVQGAGSMHPFSTTAGSGSDSDSPTIQLDIELYLDISDNYGLPRCNLGTALGQCTLLSCSLARALCTICAVRWCSVIKIFN